MSELTKNISLGAIPSKNDYRNLNIRSFYNQADPAPQTFLQDVSVLDRWDQLINGSCEGQANSKEAQHQEFLESGQVRRFIPRFPYALSRKINGMPPSIQGSDTLSTMKARKQYGIPTSDTMQPDEQLPHEQYTDVSTIPSAAYTEALQYAISGYAQVGGAGNVPLADLKQSIYQFKGCVIALQVGVEWWTDKNGNESFNPNDLFPLRAPITVVGGHALWAYAYEFDTTVGKTKIYIFNSWGPGWGNSGTGWFYYEDYNKFIMEAFTSVDLPDNWQKALHSLPDASNFKHYFGKNLSFNDVDQEIEFVQQALAIDGEFPITTPVAPIYGPITKAAVAAFQKKYGLFSTTPGQYVWTGTRAKLNEMFCPIYRWAMGIQSHEGYYLGSRSYRNNNPGNIKFIGQPGATGADDKGFAKFVSYDAGLQSLINMLTNSASGNSQIYYPSMTITDFFSHYAPASDNNNVVAYANAVAQRIGVPVSTTIGTLV